MVDDLPNTVIGVMPPGFEFPARSRLWVPLRLTGQAFNCWCFNTVARLRDGQTADNARREMERLTDDLAMTRPDVFPQARPGGSRVIAMPLTTRLAGDVRTPLYVLLVSVGLVPPNEPTMVANTRYVTNGYFDAIGTPITSGRAFNDGDTPSSLRVAIVDQSLADRYWPGESPLGRRIRHGGDPARSPWLTIVGVVPNIKHARFDEDPSLQVYESAAQITIWSMYLVVQSAGSPEHLVPAIRKAIAALDPALPLFSITSMERALARTLVPRRLTNGILTGFAIAAVLLAAIGIYGVISLNVNGRLREFGVRLALGASPSDVMRIVLQGGARLALIGVASGTVAALALTPLLRDLLFHVNPHDLLTFGAVAALLSAVALVACYVPARRAMRADPTDALRAD